MRILLAEDEPQLSRAVSTVLKMKEYDVDVAENGSVAVELAGQNHYDCMVLDIMMPVMDGIEALRRIREKGDVTPVIMLTAKAEVEDRIAGLDSGADDYLTKPFAMAELAARIRSATRRKSDYTPENLSLGNLRLNMDKQELSAENSVRLSDKEKDLMRFFLLNPEKELSRDEVYERVWKGKAEEGEDIVWVYVSYLKTKLSAVCADIQISGGKKGPYRIGKV